MTDDTEVKPMTAQQTKYLRCCVPDRGAGEALQAIREGRHGTYDKATHEAVERAALERLRACEADARRLDWAERYIADIEFEPVSHDHMRQPDGYVRRVTFTHARNGTDEGPAGETFRDAIDLAIAAIDAAPSAGEAQGDGLADLIGAKRGDDGQWRLPFYGVTAGGETVAEMLPVDEWLERRREAARKLAQPGDGREDVIAALANALRVQIRFASAGFRCSLDEATTNAARAALLRILPFAEVRAAQRGGDGDE